jgi:hypothetical protein
VLVRVCETKKQENIYDTRHLPHDTGSHCLACRWVISALEVVGVAETNEGNRKRSESLMCKSDDSHRFCYTTSALRERENEAARIIGV